MTSSILPITLQAIEEDGFHISTSIEINGKKALMIIDTGASKSVFDENRIHQFVGHDQFEKQDKLSTGLGTNSMESKTVNIDSLILKEIEIKNYEATLLNLHHVNLSYEKLNLAPIDGIIGGDILTDFNAVIDYQKKELILTQY